jgi:hypothetical protein
MKMKLLMILLLMSWSFSACDQEREREISLPNEEPLITENWSGLDAPDTKIEIFDHLPPTGSIAYGLHHLEIRTAGMESTKYFLNENLGTFYEQYSSAIDEVDDEEQSQKLENEFSKDRPLRPTQLCTGETCKENMRKEINRLQKIAHNQCLNITASFICCLSDRPKEILVYLSPGELCEKAKIAQKKRAQPARNRQ